MTLEVGAPGLQLQRLQVRRNVALPLISQPSRELAQAGIIVVGAPVVVIIVVSFFVLIVGPFLKSIVAGFGSVEMISRWAWTNQRRWRSS